MNCAENMGGILDTHCGGINSLHHSGICGSFEVICRRQIDVNAEFSPHQLPKIWFAAGNYGRS